MDHGTDRADARYATVSRPAAVLLRRQGRTARLCVRDPTRTDESVELEGDRPVREGPDPVDSGHRAPGCGCASLGGRHA
ncbi:polysaccharide lyase beta-sandwich domain-containing protein [Streptomyces albogriseolus]|uniref:polysaccharide lyase beta-sandwich domain-containing protein n=1 Tax=Streptomyces albogriseolus TaxID=1887 RepID=UPI00378EEB4F